MFAIPPTMCSVILHTRCSNADHGTVAAMLTMVHYTCGGSVPGHAGGSSGQESFALLLEVDSAFKTPNGS